MTPRSRTAATPPPRNVVATDALEPRRPGRVRSGRHRRDRRGRPDPGWAGISWAAWSWAGPRHVVDWHVPRRCPFTHLLAPVRGDDQAQDVMVLHHAAPGRPEAIRVEIVHLELAIQVTAHRVGAEVSLLAQKVGLLDGRERKGLVTAGGIGGDDGLGGAFTRLTVRPAIRRTVQLLDDACGELRRIGTLAQPLDGKVQGELTLELEPHPDRGNRIKPALPQGRLGSQVHAAGQHVGQQPDDRLGHALIQLHVHPNVVFRPSLRG